MREMKLTDLGHQVQVDGGHRSMKPDAFDEAMAYAIKSKTHLWSMVMTHRISVDALAKIDREPPLFDAESLLWNSIGCMVCEDPYSPRLLRRACPGEPKS